MRVACFAFDSLHVRQQRRWHALLLTRSTPGSNAGGTLCFWFAPRQVVMQVAHIAFDSLHVRQQCRWHVFAFDSLHSQRRLSKGVCCLLLASTTYRGAGGAIFGSRHLQRRSSEGLVCFGFATPSAGWARVWFASGSHQPQRWLSKGVICFWLALLPWFTFGS